MRIPITNNTAMPIYVGSSMIPAGETRDFEENDVPLHLRPAPASVVLVTVPDPAAARQSALAALLAQPEVEILIALPRVPDEDLTALEAIEKAAEKPRQGVLEALGAELLARAGQTDEERAAARKAAEAEIEAQARRAELAVIVTEKVDDIRERFSTFSDQDLTVLAELEGAKKSLLGMGGPRKTLLQAIEDELAQRAAAGAGQG